MIEENPITLSRENINAFRKAETFVVRKNDGHDLAEIDITVKTKCGESIVTFPIECDTRIKAAFHYDPYLSVAQTNTAKFLSYALRTGDTLELFAHIDNSSDFTKRNNLVRDELYLIIYRKGKKIGSVMLNATVTSANDNFNRLVK